MANKIIWNFVVDLLAANTYQDMHAGFFQIFDNFVTFTAKVVVTFSCDLKQELMHLS